jgi:hypothetical protein
LGYEMSYKREIIDGPFDGVQTDFQTQGDYVPGTLRVFHPQLLVDPNVVELGGKDFRLVDAPKADDFLMVWYRPG